MKSYYFVLITAAVMTCAGCWSISSVGQIANAQDAPSNMTEEDQSSQFLDNLPKGFVTPNDAAGRLLLGEYGAVFVAQGGAIPPKKVVFENEADVAAFQSTLKTTSDTSNGVKFELQAPAMKALNSAQAEARSVGLSISPRGADSARRNYDQTVSLWASRVNPGLVYWVGKGRITQAVAARIKKMTPYEQVSEILQLEQDKIFFAKSLDKSIIYSVAPPGTSQHLSMLALDVRENEDPRVRQIMAKHGWFQTVVSDLPHFTYLGVPEAKLEKLGLKKVTNSNRTFWIPAIVR